MEDDLSSESSQPEQQYYEDCLRRGCFIIRVRVISDIVLTIELLAFRSFVFLARIAGFFIIHFLLRRAIFSSALTTCCRSGFFHNANAIANPQCVCIQGCWGNGSRCVYHSIHRCFYLLLIVLPTTKLLIIIINKKNTADYTLLLLKIKNECYVLYCIIIMGKHAQLFLKTQIRN